MGVFGQRPVSAADIDMSAADIDMSAADIDMSGGCWRPSNTMYINYRKTAHR
jgi:hypothetical protein